MRCPDPSPSYIGNSLSLEETSTLQTELVMMVPTLKHAAQEVLTFYLVEENKVR
jgi:hypothetical protein